MIFRGKNVLERFKLFGVFQIFYVFLSSISFFSCEKSVRPNIFYALGGFDVRENSFFAEKILIVSFPSRNPKNICLVKLFPESSLSVLKSYHDLKGTNFLNISISGVAELYAKNCFFKIEDVILYNGIVRVLKNELIRFEVIDGEIIFGENMKISKGQGFIPEKNEIYAIKDKTEIVFPRDGQDLYIPFFLWRKVDNVKNYYLEVALDRDFLFPIFIAKLEDNKFFPSELTFPNFSKNFFWRVWYETSSGACSFWSDTGTFKIPGQN
jgi:hypothetical protein